VTNLKKLAKLTHQLELHENDFIDYVTKADYSIVLVSEAGRIKWCNDYFQRSFEVDKGEIHNKGLSTILGIDVLIGKKRTSTVQINDASHTVKVTDLTRDGKLIHKKVTLISHE
jgi:c-di-AMP phosphodiesterase-like protein|tara:strand:- start:384 stop:725 length:342 start_codon:yes stop_codon:yes gene_type:complete